MAAAIEAGAKWQGGGLKPPLYDGLEEHWQEWSLVMRAFLGGQALHSQSLLSATERRDGPDVSMSEVELRIGADGVMGNKNVFFTLVMKVQGSAQMINRGVEAQSGAAACRKIIIF